LAGLATGGALERVGSSLALVLALAVCRTRDRDGAVELALFGTATRFGSGLVLARGLDLV
jgi:hypothetical protein